MYVHVSNNNQTQNTRATPRPSRYTNRAQQTYTSTPSARRRRPPVHPHPWRSRRRADFLNLAVDVNSERSDWPRRRAAGRTYWPDGPDGVWRANSISTARGPSSSSRVTVREGKNAETRATTAKCERLISVRTLITTISSARRRYFVYIVRGRRTLFDAFFRRRLFRDVPTRSGGGGGRTFCVSSVFARLGFRLRSVISTISAANRRSNFVSKLATSGRRRMGLAIYFLLKRVSVRVTNIFVDTIGYT